MVTFVGTQKDFAEALKEFPNPDIEQHEERILLGLALPV